MHLHHPLQPCLVIFLVSLNIRVAIELVNIIVIVIIVITIICFFFFLFIISSTLFSEHLLVVISIISIVIITINIRRSLSLDDKIEIIEKEIIDNYLKQKQ